MPLERNKQPLNLISILKSLLCQLMKDPPRSKLLLATSPEYHSSFREQLEAGYTQQ